MMRVKYEIIFRCNGAVILAPSPWEGETTPNINGEERFLRGGLDADQLQTEEDSLQAHTHDISDSGHDHGYEDIYAQNGTRIFNCGYNCYANFNTGSHSSTTNSATSNLKVTDVNGARTSDETRPKNIRVVYIMKVF
jgi:hypothetical protein